MPSFFRVIWHRKSMVIGIMILSSLFGYTAASLIKNPYIAQSVFIIEKSQSEFYKDLIEIEKRKVSTIAFYKLSPEEQSRFKNNFKMDVSLTGKLYDHYVGRSVDYAHRYDPPTILALQFDTELFLLPSQNIKLVFYAPSRNFAVTYSRHILEAYKFLLKDKYSFISGEYSTSTAASDKEVIRIVPAASEKDLRINAERYLGAVFLFIGFITGCCVSYIMEIAGRYD